MGRFDNRVVVITGAGGGLGRAHALAFAHEGARVVVNDLGGARDGTGGGSSMADLVVSEIIERGGEAVANYDTVATQKGAEAIVGTALETFDRIDVMVNNAGILRDKTLLKLTGDRWQEVIDVHLSGTFYCTQAAARAMAEQGEGGRIINTTSFAGLKGNFGQTNYGAAKAGIYGLTLVASMELAKHGITVNAIAPLAKTRMTDDIDMVPDQMAPEQCSPIVLFLASDAAASISGRVFGAHGRHYFEYKMMTTDGVNAKTDWTIESIEAALPQIECSGQPAPAPAAQTRAPHAPATPAERLAEVFRRMPDGFLADKAAGWNAVMHFQIAGGGDFTVKVDSGTCTSAQALEGTPTCVVQTDLETFLGMVDGKVDGQQAFMQGTIKATNLGDMMKYRSAFSKEKATATAAASAAPAAGDTDPEECVRTLFELAGELLTKRGDERLIDLDLGTVGRWRLTWGTHGATTQRLAGEPSVASRIVTDPTTFYGLLDGSLDASAAVRGLTIVATRMADLTALLAALREADWEKKVFEALANRPVAMTRRLRRTTVHGEPVIVHREHALAYARATDDENAAYEQGAVPPLLAVRYHLELAKTFLGDPGMRVDLAQLVHGEQEMVFHKPIRALDVLSPEASLHALEHKASGSLLQVRYRLLCGGECLNETVSGYFVRRRDGGRKRTRSATPGGSIDQPDFETRIRVREDQSRDYAEASLDINPIHTSEDVAKAAGFPGLVLHGLCTMALASRAVVEHAADNDPERLATLSVRFSKPVFMKDELTVRGTVSGSEVAFEVVNQDGLPVLTHGKAEIRATRAVRG